MECSCRRESMVFSKKMMSPPPSTVSIVRAIKFGVRASKSWRNIYIYGYNDLQCSQGVLSTTFTNRSPQWIRTEKILLSLNNTEPYTYCFNSTSPRCIQQLDNGHLLSRDWVHGLRMLMFNSKLSIKLVPNWIGLCFDKLHSIVYVD